MRLFRWGAQIVVHAPAKLNLFFEVLGKRVDGYHEVETLMCPIDLYDTLLFSEEPSGLVRFACAAGDCAPGPCPEWLREVPTGPENLVVRAVQALRERSGINRGLAIRLVKRIPTAAGLGGGSADAAAALVGANAFWHLGYTRQQLSRIAAELGSDVPFFLANGPAVCRGRGELLEPVGGLGGLHFVVVRPPAGLSTAEVYRACRPAQQPRQLEPVLAALRRGGIRCPGGQFFNRLQSAAEGLSPWIGRLRRKFEGLDCRGHAMSGSGSAYFGLCRHAGHARRVAGRLKANGFASVFAVRSCC